MREYKIYIAFLYGAINEFKHPIKDILDMVSGSDTISGYGIYATEGVASLSNIPGARYDSVSWIDGSGRLWLFFC